MTLLNRYTHWFLLFILCFSAHTQSANPIVTDRYTADPTIRFFEGKYWMYTTHDEAANNLPWFDMRDWRAYSSVDLTDWVDHGAILSLTDIPWASSNAYATDVVERDGKYYLYFPVKNDQGFHIGVAVGDTPIGPFVDAIGKPLLSDGMENDPSATIDPGVFIDDDGQAYLYFGNDDPIISFLERGAFTHGKKVPKVVKLKDNMIELDSEIMDVQGINNFFEAPWMHKRDGVYYLSYSGNGINADILYATADNPLGPFEMKHVINSRMTYPFSFTNHHSIIDNHETGESFFFYHTTHLSKGNSFKRSTAADRLYYNDEGDILPVKRTFMGLDDKLYVNVGETSAGFHSKTSEGLTYHKDRNFPLKTLVHTTTDPIEGTDFDELYQVQRYKKFSFFGSRQLTYEFVVENGDYDIQLHFAETYFNNKRMRLFDISLENNTVYESLDIYAEVGKNHALIKHFDTQVDDGKLTIKLTASRNNATLAGIGIVRKSN